MIDAKVDAQFAARQADGQDLIRFKRQMDGLKQRIGAPEDREQKLRDACEKFEAVFISKLWKEMRSTVPKDGMMQSKQQEQYLSMFDREFAETMSRNGGIGLADMIYDQLSEKLRNTSRNTLSGGVNIRPIEPEPIPLNAGRNQAVPLSQERSGMTLEDWGGAAENVPAPQAVQGTTVSAHEGGAVDMRAGMAAATTQPQANPMNDVEVKAQLEILARKLEAERIKQGLLGGMKPESGV